jgi:CBS domain-containing protein
MQKVSELMTEKPTTLPASATVVQAAQCMRDQNIGAIVVMDDQKLRGIVTDRDIVVRGVADGTSIAQKTLESVCSPSVMTLTPDDDADRAVTMMRERAIRRVPVVSGDQVVGIVSLGDLAIERDSGSALGDISSAPSNQ